MQLSLTEVERIAELAKLGITEEEKRVFQEQLSAILEYASKLQELDTKAILPTATVLPVRSVMRPDDRAASMPREDVLANAPHGEEGCFQVWTVLED